MAEDDRTGDRRGLPVRLLAGAVVVTVVVTGAVVATGVLFRPGDTRPTTRELSAPSASPTPERRRSAPASGLHAANLLGPDGVRVLDPRRSWRVVRTRIGPAAATGLRSACRQGRVADPDRVTTAVRETRTPGSPRRVAVQTAALSRTPQAAAAAYRTIVGWYAACRAARLQLVDAHVVDGVGDRAQLLTFRRWRRPATTLSVAVARVGTATTSVTSTARAAADSRGPRAAARMLSTAVVRLCPVAETVAGCRHRPRVRPAVPPPSGTGAGLLAAVDLPPVGRVDRAWVGTRPTRPHVDRATTRCDRVTLFAAGATRARARTFLVPGASLPARFGLSETYGVFPTARAAGRFVAGVRRSVAGCEKRDPATEVGRERRTLQQRLAAAATSWELTTQVSRHGSVRYRLGLVRVGRTVARVTFTPTRGSDMGPAAFDALLERAGDRLRELGDDESSATAPRSHPAGPQTSRG